MTASPLPRADVEASVVVRTRNEADRLRLTLASLARQTQPAEVIVVDDGSEDHTGAVIEAAELRGPVQVIRHPAARGRSVASNSGAGAARGAILIFLDGDTLASPTLVEDHTRLHNARGELIGRGETWHLRCTRMLLDPETGTAQPEHADRVGALSEAERESLRVTRAQIEHDFDAVLRRSAPGIYPGIGPRRLHEIEMDALRRHPDCTVLWAAASGSNLSVERHAFLEAGGFDARLDINEHRELALRMCLRGARMRPVEPARTFHLTHRSGWRDPLQHRDWLDIMSATHAIPAVRLLPVLWAGLTGASVPEIASLPDLERRAASVSLDSANETPRP